MDSYQRHLQLRKAFSLLEPAAQEEFTGGLTRYLEITDWRTFEEKESLQLLKAPNLEEKITNVFRRIQETPILCSDDIKEAFFRLWVSPRG